MPLPLAPLDTRLLRFRLLYQGVPRAITPAVSSDLVLTREPGEEGAFYYRDKLGNGTFTFSGPDFAFLNQLNRSTARCARLGLQVQHRGSPELPWETWTGAFTCNDCTGWNEATCTVQLTPAPADAYELLLQNWEKEYNILLTPSTRVPVTAQLVTLGAGISIEFKRVGPDEEATLVGTDGWAVFLQNRSYIGNNIRETNDILFRYRLRSVPMDPNGQGGFAPVDKSAGGWQALLTTFDGTAGTVDYVKSPGISGFKTYKIGTYADWNDPRNPGSYPRYGDQLLLVDANSTPSAYGYRNADYLQVTGPDGFGAFSAECPGALTLRVRRSPDDDQCSRLYWKFGSFTFGRCFPLLDGLYNLLSQTITPFYGQALLPPSPAQLSSFLSQEQNQATGETGPANELPRLLLAAGSDVKRYGSSEAASRLLISLKQLLADLGALWDAGWFVDPTTGWLRFEHRAYFEAQLGQGGTVDLRTLEEALLSNAYDFRVQLLPRYEELTISNAATEDPVHEAYFAKGSLDYGLGGCVNQREGQNKVSLSVSRLTGDVSAAVLSGDQLPDNALVVLAPDAAGQLPQANRELAATWLLRRYYVRGRPANEATVEGPAPILQPNSVVGALPVSGVPATILSLKPAREQVSPASGRLPALSILAPDATYTTNLGAGGQLGKAELNLRTRQLKTTIWLPGFADLLPPPSSGRQFDGSFDQSFN